MYTGMEFVASADLDLEIYRYTDFEILHLSI